MKKTYAAWLIAIGGLLAYEGWTVANNTPGDTLSEAVWSVASYPLVPLLVGILIGHFFWQRRRP